MSATLSSPLIFTMINASFNSFSIHKNSLGFYDYSNNNKPEFDHFNRIPDFVAGTLADMTKTTVSKEKFVTVLTEYLTLKEKNHIAKVYFESEKYGVNTVILNKK